MSDCFDARSHSAPLPAIATAVARTSATARLVLPRAVCAAHSPTGRHENARLRSDAAVHSSRPICPGTPLTASGSSTSRWCRSASRTTCRPELVIARVMIAEAGDIGIDSDVRGELERVAAYGFAGGAMDALYEINPMAMRRRREERQALALN